MCQYSFTNVQPKRLSIMRHRYRFVRKSYAMTRMAAAIERAIEATTIKEKDRAARWAAAWGLLCGIKTRPVYLKRSEIGQMNGVRNADQEATSLDFPDLDFNVGQEHAATMAGQGVAQRQAQPGN